METSANRHFWPRVVDFVNMAEQHEKPKRRRYFGELLLIIVDAVHTSLGFFPNLQGFALLGLRGRQISMRRDKEALKEQVKENTSPFPKSPEQQVHAANSRIDKFQEKLKKQQKKVSDTRGIISYPSVRLRLESIRLRPICHLAYDSYIKALKLNCLKVLVEPRRKTKY